MRVERIACIIDSWSADALQHRVRTDAVGQILDAGDAFVTALGHDVGRAELAGELLPRRVTAHRDDPLGTHLPGREHTEEADRAVTDDRDRPARLHVGRIGGEPAGAHDVGEREQARDEVIRGGLPASRTKVPSASGTRATGACALTTNSRCWQRGLVADSAVWTGVVGGEERTDDELAGLDGCDRAADLLDDAAVLVPHRRSAASIGLAPRYGHRSDPHTQVAEIRMMASVGSTIFGSSRSSKRTSRGA